MKYQYDSKIKSMRNDFRLVVESVLRKMFNVDLEYTQGIKRMYIDLNSCLSIMFRHDDIADEELTRIVSDEIEKFITKHIDSGMSLYFMYSIKPSKVHKTIYPEWCANRDARVSIVKSDFLKKLLVTLKVFSEKNRSIKIVNTGEVHPAVAVVTMDKNNTGGAVVLSKDLVFKCIEKSNINIYNGVEWVAIGENMFNSETNVFLSNPTELTAYYLVLRGDPRNEYKGMLNYGKIKSKDYVEANKLKFKADVDHPLKEFMDINLPLYNINKLIDKTKELGLNIDQFKGI